MKKISVILIFCVIITGLFAREFKFREIKKTIVLKDGSVLYGRINDEKSTKDSINFSSKYLHATIARKGIKFFGKNLNSGIMFGVLPFFNFYSHKDNYFVAPIIGTLARFNEHVSSGIEIVYFSKRFSKTATKYLYEDSESNGDLIEGKYKYSGNYFIPTYTFKINIIPSEYKMNLDDKNIYPYLGLGLGYDFARVKYNITDMDSVYIRDKWVDKKDLENVTHTYLGLNYKLSVGFSYKIQDRITLVFEILYYNAIFKQSLSNTEEKVNMKRDKFYSKGISAIIGFRFGKF